MTSRAIGERVDEWRRWLGALRCLVGVLVFAMIGPAGAPPCCTAEENQAEESTEDADADGEEPAEPQESGVFLPTDRFRERQLDRARRLVADARWSDAATLCDEILAAERDVFVRRAAAGGGDRGSWISIKAETSRLIGTLPAAGRDAYELQFRARAERQLADAVAAGDVAAIAAVASRWFNTSAGRRAALLAALGDLESSRPLAAAAWLDRLASAPQAAALEPTLSVMRAVAWHRAGDGGRAAGLLEAGGANLRGELRIGGRVLVPSFQRGEAVAWLRGLLGGDAAAATGPGDDWRQPRGDASRNALVAASRPLLVPRYRVPLSRHPEETRLLEKRRRTFADQEMPLFPAGMPLAVDGTILAHTPLGLLAIDFETGKRIWMQPGHVGTADAAFADADADEGGDTGLSGGLARAFDDATSGTLSSDGRLVFAIDSHPDSVTALAPGNAAFGIAQPRADGWQGGNTLSAYDIAHRGSLRWRLPKHDGGLPAGAAASKTWFAGPPLVVGDQLFVMVEEKSEIRLDVLDAADGALRWSQPLAELDETQAIRARDAVARRLAGLTPALGDGVLVCPIGAGSVVAIDLASRTLLWAYGYSVRAGDADGEPLAGVRQFGLPRGMRGAPRGDGTTGGTESGDRWCNDSPIIAAGRVLLAPYDSEELHCLDLRGGDVRWREPRRGRLVHVAGIAGGRAVVVARRDVEAFDMETGKRVWRRELGRGVGPSGRGILTADRLFLPLDTPEVVEIDLADGAVAGRSPARGNAVPGNLVVYRGEVISQSADSLDVFHQAADLESRVETAERADPQDVWAGQWRGHLAIDRGDVRAGLERLLAAGGTAGSRLAPHTLAASFIRALERDFDAAAPAWTASRRSGDPQAAPSRAVARAAVDGFLARGRAAEAWEGCRDLLVREPSADAEEVARDSRDPGLHLTEDRWLRGRLRDLCGIASPELRAAIDADATAAVAAAEADPDPVRAARRLGGLVARLGDLPQGMAARSALAARLDPLVQAAGTDRSTAVRGLAVRKDFLLLELAAGGDAGQRETAANAMASVRTAGSAMVATDPDVAWPLGRVVPARPTAGQRKRGTDDSRTRTMPLPVADAGSFLPGLGVAADLQHQRLLFTDGCGRLVGRSESLDPEGRGNVGFNQFLGLDGAEAAAVGRVVYAWNGGRVSAWELGGRGRVQRRLWTAGEQRPATTPIGRLRPAPGGRIARNGSVPLGMRINEPEGPPTAASLWGRATTAGVPIYTSRSLAVHDPVDGSVVWERHRLPAAVELIADAAHVCVGTADGRPSPVLAMADGRIVHDVALPDRRQRLHVSGCRVLSIVPGSADAIAATVQLELLDVTTRQTTVVAECSGSARATTAGPGRVAVLDPGGELLVIDLPSASVAFRTRLAEMPERCDAVHVMPWRDRLLVFVGRQEGISEGSDGDRRMVSPLQQQLVAGHDAQPSSFTIWAVDSSSGAPLWDAPATVARHYLHSDQPADLPVLLFCRQFQQPDSEGARLDILCLDVRTGHAVFQKDGMQVQPHMLFGCDLVGDPDRHLISVRQHGGELRQMDLEFTGVAGPPQPPYRAASRVRRSAGPLEWLERWLEPVLGLPRQP